MSALQLKAGDDTGPFMDRGSGGEPENLQPHLAMPAEHTARTFMWIVAVCGAIASLISIARLPLLRLGWPFVLLTVVAVIVGSRGNTRVPGFKTNISFSDVFIFMAILLFGGEAAVLLGATESYVTSLRITRKPLTRIFNSACVALTTFITAEVVRMVIGHETVLAPGESFFRLVLVACVMGVTQYLGNSWLIAAAGALRSHGQVIAIWREHYQWVWVSYVTAAIAAGLMARLDAAGGFHVVVAALPIAAVVYLTYMTHLKNLRASAANSEQAKRHLLELEEREERFRNAFDFAPIGMALVAPDGRWLRVNHSLCEIVGYTEEELLEKTFQDITHPGDLPKFLAWAQSVLSDSAAARQMEKRYTHKLGHEVWVLVSISQIRETQAMPTHLIFQIQHISDRKQAEERLLHEVFHDALTGLPNRAHFMDRLRAELDLAAAQPGRIFAVLFLDLDRFKVINDSIGHLFGDQLLIGIADRLHNCLRASDAIARLGGDEFTILLPEIQDETDATRVADRIKRAVAMPFRLGDYETCATASIGIAIYRGDYTRPEDLLRDADTAMYRAKTLGKAQYSIFDKTMHASAMNRMRIETDLRRAIERQEFILHYQPIVSLDTGNLTGFEALVRWRHPEKGLIPPDTFIPVAEESGCIVPMGLWVMREACSQMKLWQEQFSMPNTLSVSVNLSSRQFGHADLLEQVIDTLQSTGLEAGMLKLEITESAVMDNIEVATIILEKLQAIGVELSIDDFGTGYSSLSYLHRLPIDTLKIDRSFVSRINENSENKEIVRTIILLAQTLGKGVVAEGIETKEQLELLRELKCESGQGYLFSRPVDSSSAGQLLWESLHWQGRLRQPSSAEEASFGPLISSYQM
ncbi:MAG TPA: EAL domain-containing protein [Blastocatellia bacterium]|nr:EAL domain-containing protein [Blastocatellia bacterium]